MNNSRKLVLIEAYMDDLKDHEAVICLCVSDTRLNRWPHGRQILRANPPLSRDGHGRIKSNRAVTVEGPLSRCTTASSDAPTWSLNSFHTVFDKLGMG